MLKKQFHPLSKTVTQDLPEIKLEPSELDELELAKMQSLKSVQEAFKKSLDFMPHTFFMVLFIAAFAVWWSSFK